MSERLTAPEPSWHHTRPPRWLPRATLVVALTLLAVGVAFGVVMKLESLIVIVVAALFLGFAIEPGVDTLARRGMRRGLAAGLIYLGILLALVGMAALMGGLLVDQVAQLGKALPGTIDSLGTFLRQHFHVSLQQQLHRLQENAGSFGGTIASNALDVGATVVGSVFDLLSVALFGFYFAVEGPKFRRTVCSVLPPARQRLVLQVWELAMAKTAGYLYSRLLLALLSGVAHGVFFAIIQVPYALTLGLFVGFVGQFIPTVGTYIGAALPALVALGQSPTKALLVIGFAVLYQQIENYVLTPPLSARTMELHPAVAFGSVIAGVMLVGPVGALLALPVAATVQAVVSSYVQRHDLVESELFEDRARPRDAGPDDPGDPTREEIEAIRAADEDEAAAADRRASGERADDGVGEQPPAQREDDPAPDGRTAVEQPVGDEARDR